MNEDDIYIYFFLFKIYFSIRIDSIRLNNWNKFWSARYDFFYIIVRFVSRKYIYIYLLRFGINRVSIGDSIQQESNLSLSNLRQDVGCS